MKAMTLKISAFLIGSIRRASINIYVWCYYEGTDKMEPYPLFHLRVNRGEPQTQSGAEPCKMCLRPSFVCICGSLQHTLRWLRGNKSSKDRVFKYVTA